ncbi:MAG TPA: hypothetical protein VI916_08630, partial [Acidimicrobiia bacterium]|nr:hypothetical protein [Acidimicrobiia bacterium]
PRSLPPLVPVSPESRTGSHQLWVPLCGGHRDHELVATRGETETSHAILVLAGTWCPAVNNLGDRNHP